MSRSSLATRYVPASTNNYTQGRRGYKICKITPHHMAGKLSAQRCGELFQNPNRQASSNYGIGYDGEIACYVDEENRAWTSSNRANDCQAITIEVSNSGTGGNWLIPDAAWNSLVNLCVDICKRYGFRLTYDGTPNGSLTRHNMFANTNCPGPYLQGRFPELVQVVNSRLDGENKPEPVNNEKSIEELARAVIRGEYGNGDERKNRLGSRYNEVQARVNEILLGTKPVSNRKSNEEIATEVIRGNWGNGQERKDRLTNAGYDYYAIQRIVNKRLLG